MLEFISWTPWYALLPHLSSSKCTEQNMNSRGAASSGGSSPWFGCRSRSLRFNTLACISSRRSPLLRSTPRWVFSCGACEAPRGISPPSLVVFVNDCVSTPRRLRRAFLEYMLHRFLFHSVPSSYWGITAHFLLHGCHHKLPADHGRLVRTRGARAMYGRWFARFSLTRALQSLPGVPPDASQPDHRGQLLCSHAHFAGEPGAMRLRYERRTHGCFVASEAYGAVQWLRRTRRGMQVVR